jgi:hypothetical protein
MKTANNYLNISTLFFLSNNESEKIKHRLNKIYKKINNKT